MHFKLWIVMWDVFEIGRFLWPWMLLPPSFPAPFLLPSVFPSLSVITVSVSFSLYAHAMEDRVQCWVSFINHSPPGLWKSLSLYLGSQGLLLPGLLLSSSPQPWGYGCALGIQTQILMLYIKLFIDWTIAQILGGHILWLSSLVYLFCISVVDNSLPYLYFYLVCSLLWQIKPSKKKNLARHVHSFLFFFSQLFYDYGNNGNNDKILGFQIST